MSPPPALVGFVFVFGFFFFCLEAAAFATFSLSEICILSCGVRFLLNCNLLFGCLCTSWCLCSVMYLEYILVRLCWKLEDVHSNSCGKLISVEICCCCSLGCFRGLRELECLSSCAI
ncbi:hypothetical protein, unlikely [Trypanosoma brucei brucei TREU927]|uniref:Uncharacterized protein n=1 Tax=Trypanosoma brucei brucei (strain 927/4 GUTat10.1) TaxID=185431 RepID=Q38G11_TRYB2|nr:hypothetical protein, unlikely [Trypanosoma brucei brucei TREU927]EAN76259.1 hypothetical protein, unlikely [Trypanosoma brucei brucei TREU927]